MTRYAFPAVAIPHVLSPEKTSLPMRLLLAHRDKTSVWARFWARRLLSNWRLLFRVSELAPSLTRQPSSVRFTLDRIDKPLAFDARYAVFRPFYLSPLYEPEVFFLLRHLAPLIETFLDVGANLGLHSHCLAASHAFNGRIHCFEPEPETGAMLADIATQLGTAQRIEIHPFGLSDETRQARFESPAATNDTSVVRVAENDGAKGFAASLKRLDDIGLPAPSAIKIDVEGHERQAIAGGMATIRAARPYIVFETIHGARDTDAICESLRAENYEIFFLEFAASDPAQSTPELPAGQAEVRLVMNPFTPELRGARPRTLNLFACPAEKVAVLESRCGLVAL